jgi:16S rRNA processing protein RimM
MKALPLSDRLFSLSPETEVILSLKSGVSSSRKISSVKKAGKYAILAFYGISTPENAAEYRGALLETDRSILQELPEAEYFHEQIIGLTAFTTDGNIIGIVSGIFETGSNDVYVVSGNEKEYLIPAIRDVILEINLNENKMVIQPLEGLLD